MKDEWKAVNLPEKENVDHQISTGLQSINIERADVGDNSENIDSLGKQHKTH